MAHLDSFRFLLCRTACRVFLQAAPHCRGPTDRRGNCFHNTKSDRRSIEKGERMNREKAGIFYLLAATLLLPAGVVAEDAPISIEITHAPPSGEGPESRGDIAGTVQGLEKPEEYRVVIYAHTDWWYVQPEAIDPYTSIESDGTWSNWTHLGHRYAALLVKPSYQPPARARTLPKVNGEVIARAEVRASKD